MATKYKRLKRDGKVYIVSSTDGGKSWSKPKLYNSKEHKKEKQKANPKYKRLKRDGKVYVVSSTDGGKSWSKPKLYNSKDYKKGLLGNPKEKRKNNLKVEVKSINKTDYNVSTESGKKAYEKAVNESKNKKVNTNQTKEKPKTRLTKEERLKHQFIAQNEKKKIDESNKKGGEKAKGATTTGGPVKDGVKYARSKGDDLAGYRRGPNTKLGKDTRITKGLKKAGWTEDRLAAKRKAHAEWKANRKKKKSKLKIGG